MNKQKRLYPKDIIRVDQFETLSNADIIFKLTDYLHEVFGTIGCLIRDQYTFSSALYFTKTIATICRYNNIVFDSVKAIETQVDTIEPIWFSMEFSDSCNILNLYFHSKKIDELRVKCLDVDIPVILEPLSGLHLIQRYNSYFNVSQANYVHQVQPQTIAIFIIADHCAQHIIHEYCNLLKKPTPRDCIIEATKDIHETWLDHGGFTWHSVITVTAKNRKDLRNQSVSCNAKNISITNNDGIYYN